jgi:hypothetical protein
MLGGNQTNPDRRLKAGRNVEKLIDERLENAIIWDRLSAGTGNKK